MKGSQIKAALFRFRASASVDPAHRYTLLLSSSGKRETGSIKGKGVVPRGGIHVLLFFSDLAIGGGQESFAEFLGFSGKTPTASTDC
jgi:hypothetical protein